ncbi:uncharacterized protein F5147DRAFT_674473 [Suillus discolor]|uniref:Uncharacterized protein n=1 Tax=Suillus discolor TaxID=1912936 RepID=A0A9P7FGQ2_9AGAM|nr:uncharacterized protein F5147DRAFT_674473 [Suillus discolor]KAG2115760.1 hypothetical protein F5147DRAFT_674473 [Suillus discolor]
MNRARTLSSWQWTPSGIARQACVGLCVTPSTIFNSFDCLDECIQCYREAAIFCTKKRCACALLGTVTAAEQYYHTSTLEAYNTYFDLLAGNLATRSLTISRREVATAFISARSLPVDAASAVTIYDTQMNSWSRIVASGGRCPRLRKISSSRVST